MPVEVGVWRIDEGLKPLDLGALDLESRLEEILDKDISIVAPDWMVIGRQVRTSTGQRADLLTLNTAGNLSVVEIKRDKTYRDVVAQALDYGSWIKTLSSDELGQIFEDYKANFHPTLSNLSLNDAFRQRFKIEIPDELNQSHQLVIVASSLDSATERIVSYIREQSESRVDINAIFFRVFKDGDREYLTRVWFSDPTIEESGTAGKSITKSWNGEFYVSFEEGPHRRWNDARKYGFISAGGGEWYTRTLHLLGQGSRIWVNIPGTGYVGIGRVSSELVVSARNFKVKSDEGKEVSLSEVSIEAPEMFDESQDEQVVKIDWIKAVPVEQAVKEKGFFGNQNTVARPVAQRWDYTVEILKKRLRVT